MSVVKRAVKKLLEYSLSCIDWLLSIRHVSLDTRLKFDTVCRKAIQEFCSNGMEKVVYDYDLSKVLGRTAHLPGKQRILVDVSKMVEINARSGIQRVVVNVLDAMLQDQRCVYVPVAYFHGHMYRVEYCQTDCSFHLAELLQFMPGDTLLMLDSSWDHYDVFLKFFAQLRGMNGRICVVVYDLVPVLLPQYTDSGMPPMFRKWLRTAIREADSMICISSTVADQLRDYIRTNHLPIRPTGLKIGHFYLGSNFNPADSRSADPVVSDILERVKDRKKFLSVSTLEPRKNYDFMLKVVEELWKKGFDIVYFIVGKKGWNTADLVKKISHHPELNKRLFWFPYCSDSSLQQLYQGSDILLNLSHSEGYGLSLVEGAHFQCSVIASDIPVFREVISDQTTLFCNIDSLEETVDAIAAKLQADQFVPSNAKCYLWADSLDQILCALIHDKWDFTLR